MLPQRCRLALAALAALAFAPFVGLPAVATAQPSQQRTPAQVDSIAMLPSQLPLPAAEPKDVDSIDAIIAALYASISGDAGVKRDWDRLRSLFVPHARLIPTGRRPDGSGAHRVMTPEGYIALNGAALENGGFHEREIGRRTERYGNVAHVFSAYDSKRRVDDAQPFMRGINSIQLWNDGKRWYVVSIFWQSETPDNPIPEDIIGKR